MVRTVLAASVWLGASLVSAPAGAEALSGVCPDGSIFIVQRHADIPCKRAKLVDSAELPPIRPQLLPRPYNWMVDQEARNPNNPYNLVDSAQKLREIRNAEEFASESPEASPPPEPVRPATGGGGLPQRAGLLRLEEPELRDLARIVILRQRFARAALTVDDVHGDPQLMIELAHSPAFESRVLESVGRDDGLVVAFVARATESVEFWPNFLVVQGARTFRPDAAHPEELGILLGAPGQQSRGELVLGYFVLPEQRFDPTQPMDLWWNDRSVRATLEP